MRKICKKCKEEKDLSMFYLDKGGRDGTRNICKECMSNTNSEKTKKRIESLSLESDEISLKGEIWENIYGYENYYQVSNLGRIKSLNRISNKHSKKECIIFLNGKLMKSALDKDGYLLITLSKNGKRKMYKVHRLVALAFIPNPENKPEVNHKKGIKTDNRVSELEWNTVKENFIHAANNNLTAKGEKQGLSKLKNEDVLKIRKLYTETDLSTIKLAKIFNVTQSHISCIIRRKNWKHI